MIGAEAFTQIERDTKQAVAELLEIKPLNSRHLLVVGVSTSEVLGERIGTSGTEAVASAIFEAIEEARQQHGFHIAYQSCEHINRSLVVQRQTAEQFQLEEVMVVPAPKAGGAMAAFAYRHLSHTVMVEHVKADAGIDIGDTFIGMHLKHVVVPVRPSIKQIGQAHLTMAMTRPKLIGGARAIYQLEI